MKIHSKKSTIDPLIQIEFDDRNDVFSFGKGNDLLDLIDIRFLQSPTASLCLSKASKAIYGKGFEENPIVNKDGQTLNQILKIASKEFEKYGNAFIHVGYNGDFQFNSLKVIPFNHIRVGKADDLGYSGKFVKYDWSAAKVNSDDFIYIDKFNPIEKVVETQIKAAEGIKSYKGQIIHLQKEYGNVYSVPKIYPSLHDTELEYNSSVFRANGASKGFLSTKLLVTSKLDADGRKDLKKTVDGLQGASNSNSVIVMELDEFADGVKDKFSLEDLVSSYNDDLFQYSDKQSEKNICKSMNVPIQLVTVDDNSLFGSSGEIIRAARQHLWEQQEEERQLFEETFTRIMKNFENPIEQDLVIKNPYQNDADA